MSYKIILHVPEVNACSYYRAILPTMQCYGDLSRKDIQVTPSEKMSLSEKADVYVLHRIIKPDLYNFIYTAKCNGAKIVWHTDDDVFNVPFWNPFAEKISEDDLKVTTEVIKLSDALFVSTNKLGESLKIYDKPTYVLPNLIDLCCFNYQDRKNEISDSKFKYSFNKPIEILWAGGPTHDEDLLQIVESVIKLIEKYNDKIHFTFMGYLPTELSEFVRFAGRNVAYIKSKYEKHIGYMTEVPLRLYYDTIQSLKPDIGIAPLCDCPFNDSKSAIKSYEMLMSGAAFIGTNSHPYSWVNSNRTGILVGFNDTKGWIASISELVEDTKKRKSLFDLGKKEVMERHSWQSSKKNIWIESFESLIK